MFAMAVPLQCQEIFKIPGTPFTNVGYLGMIPALVVNSVAFQGENPSACFTLILYKFKQHLKKTKHCVN